MATMAIAVTGPGSGGRPARAGRPEVARPGKTTKPSKARAARVRVGSAPQGWELVPQILKRVEPPTFPNRDCDVTRFGAVPDGKADAAAAFAAAISSCRHAGGGRVLVPPGVYYSKGPIHLASNINLHVSKGATIKFSNDPNDYLPVVLVRWEGTRCYNYSPLIYAYREKNIAITGGGTLDGQAARDGSGWLKMVTKIAERGRSRAELRSMGRTGVPLKDRVFGPVSNLRPPFFHAYESENILVEGVTFAGSPFWTVTPAFSRNITVRGISVQGNRPELLHNDDGVVVDSCRDVLVESSRFDTVCDGVAIKAGRDHDGWEGTASENVVVRNSTFVHSWGAMTVGSEVSGGVRNIFFENNAVLEARFGTYVKTNGQRGGVVEGVYARNLRLKETDECIRVESAYMDIVKPWYPTVMRGFRFEGITCEKAKGPGIRSEGLAASPISDMLFRNVIIHRAAPPVFAHTHSSTFDNVVVNGVPIQTLARY